MRRFVQEKPEHEQSKAIIAMMHKDECDSTPNGDEEDEDEDEDEDDDIEVLPQLYPKIESKSKHEAEDDAEFGDLYFFYKQISETATSGRCL